MVNERAWYIVQTYSGLESAAKRNLDNRVDSMNMQDYVFQVLVPEEKSMERKKTENLKKLSQNLFLVMYSLI